LLSVAVWLDDNDVYGSIPTEIALLTDLASISITNSSLTGKIPTEMGNLYGLRRLWLYGNDLTGGIPSQLSNLEQLEVLELHDNDISGAVPQGICASIQKSEYELKALTADCNPGADISCPEDCCTKCHD
jgi:Leucine-rich repeat (LRR) protein